MGLDWARDRGWASAHLYNVQSLLSALCARVLDPACLSMWSSTHCHLWEQVVLRPLPSLWVLLGSDWRALGGNRPQEMPQSES